MKKNKTNVIELEITPEIEKLIEDCINLPFNGTELLTLEVGHLIGKISHEYVKAKKQPVIEEMNINGPFSEHTLIVKNKIKQIIHWINNHEGRE